MKADSLGSLEALLTLLKQANISVVKAGIGPIGKSDFVSAKANLELNPLTAHNLHKPNKIPFENNLVNVQYQHLHF